MKDLHLYLYITGLVIILTALLGGSLTREAFGNMADRSLKTAGVDKAKIDSVDAGLDDMFYKMNQVMLQVEKLKSFFSDKKPDESQYRKEEKHLISGIIYEPMRNTLIYLYRALFFTFGAFVLIAGGIMHIAWRNVELRRRITRLEEAVRELR